MGHSDPHSQEIFHAKSTIHYHAATYVARIQWYTYSISPIKPVEGEASLIAHAVIGRITS